MLEVRGQRYRLNTPTLAILIQDGPKVAVTIPAGSIVDLINGPLDGTRLVDATWDGKTVMIFTTDIRERGERLAGR